MESKLEALERIYAAIADAFSAKDLEGITKFIAPDWSGSYGEATVTRDQLVANVRSQFETLDEISWPRTIRDAHLDGSKVTVRAEGMFRAIKKDGREPLEIQIANEDTWLQGPDGWQNIFSKEA